MPHNGAGGAKMDTQTWADVRRLKELGRLSERKIAEQLNVSRGKVRRALAGPPSQRPVRQRSSKLDSFKGVLKEILEEYPELSSRRIFEKLQDRGYPGGLTIVKDYLMTLRGQKLEAFVRYETGPGEEAQVDWGYAGTFPFEGYARKIYFFVIVLGYSRKLYVEFTTSQSLESFLQCHLNSFKYFGGVPKNLRYDNLKSVVISRYLKHIRFNQKFLEFAGYYLFVPQVCNVGRGNEKGKVESGVGYVKKNFLAGREFRDFADLERQLREWLKQANQRQHGTTKEIPEKRFQKEKEYLLPLQANDYDTTTPLAAKAHHDCFLRFETNYYSVPSKYILLPLTLRAGKYQLKVFYQQICIATHQRSYGKNRRIEDPKHFQELLKIKKAAHNSKLRDRFLSLAPCCAQYFDGLLGLEKDIKAEIKRIMNQVDLYGVYEIISAIEKALSHKAFGAVYVKNIIAQNRARRQEKEITPLRLSQHPELEEMEVAPQDLVVYDRLFEEREQIEKQEETNHG